MTTVSIEPWGPDDLPLVEKVMGDPRMTKHLGGAESPEKLADRQRRYAALAGTGTGRMFKILDVPSGEAVGSVGYWEKEWRGETIYETGWSVIPEFQGRGIAAVATTMTIEVARSDGKHRFLYAFPGPDNAGSNAICRKLGFELVGQCEFEFPPGHVAISNEWRLDLTT